MAQSTLVQKLRTQTHIFSWTGAVLLIGVIALLNFIFGYFPIRMDTSMGGVYSLTKGTRKLVSQLDDILIARMYFSSDLPPNLRFVERYVRDMLSEYRRASGGRIKVEYVDPSQSMKAKQDAISEGVYPVQLNVIQSDKQELKEAFLGVTFIYGDKKETNGFIKDTVGLEYEFSQRIQKLIKPRSIKIGIISNGKSLTLGSDALKQLTEPLHQLYKVEEVDLSKGIPPDLNSLWLIGPSEPLESVAVAKLREWVQAGGFLGLFIDRFNVDIQSARANPIQIGLDDLLKEWGIDFRSALIVDPQATQIGIRANLGNLPMEYRVNYPYFPMILNLDPKNPMTNKLSSLSLPFVSPLFVENPVAGLSYSVIGRSSKYSWLDKDVRSVSPMMKMERPAQTENGPFQIGLVVEGKFNASGPETKKGRVLIMGSSRFIRSDYPTANTSNFDFFFNALDMSGQDNFLLEIRSKGAPQRYLKIMPQGLQVIFKYGMALFLPLASLLAGFVILTIGKKRLLRLASTVYKEV